MLSDTLSPDDKEFEKVKDRFEGKKSVCGHLWSGGTQGTMFPLTPMIDNKIIWVSCAHTTQAENLRGNCEETNSSIGTMMHDDFWALHRLTDTAGKRSIACPVTGELMGKEKADNFIWVPDFCFMESSSHGTYIPTHFWIPDPAPLQEQELVVVFGIPRSPDYNLFSVNSKVAAIGRMVKSAGNDLICYDASTTHGMCGSVGVAFNRPKSPFTFSFIHLGAHMLSTADRIAHRDPTREHNHGLSVRNPEFKASYIKHIVPRLREGHLSVEQLATLDAYLNSP